MPLNDTSSPRLVKLDARHPRKALSDALRSSVWVMTRGRCFYCGQPCNPYHNLTIDHITPLSRGGTNEIENLVIACRRCNLQKGTKLLSEWTPAKPFWFLSDEYEDHYGFERYYTIWEWRHPEGSDWEAD